jgi:hypothetical protein
MAWLGVLVGRYIVILLHMLRLSLAAAVSMPDLWKCIYVQTYFLHTWRFRVGSIEGIKETRRGRRARRTIGEARWHGRLGGSPSCRTCLSSVTRSILAVLHFASQPYSSPQLQMV